MTSASLLPADLEGLGPQSLGSSNNKEQMGSSCLPLTSFRAALLCMLCVFEGLSDT